MRRRRGTQLVPGRGTTTQEPVAVITRLPPALYAAFSAYADERHKSMASILRRMVAELLKADDAEEPKPDLKACRTLLQVAQVAACDGEEMVGVIITSWDPCSIVWFPAVILPPALRVGLAEGSYLIAAVNTDAERTEDLRFANFEPAPEPVPEEELQR